MVPGGERFALPKNEALRTYVSSLAHQGRHAPRRRGIQYAAAYRFHHCCLWNTGSSAFADDDVDPVSGLRLLAMGDCESLATHASKRSRRSLLSMRLLCFNKLDLILRSPHRGRLEGWPQYRFDSRYSHLQRKRATRQVALDPFDV